MDYKKVLRLHYVNHLSGKEISLCCNDCSKSSEYSAVAKPSYPVN